MTPRLMPLAALAAAFAAAPALADNNAAFLRQTGLSLVPGTGNTALIDQAQGSGNAAGSAVEVMLQLGQDNSLVITQAGSRNAVGLGIGGLRQASFTGGATSNTAEIVQRTADNAVVLSLQFAGSGAAPQSGNTLTIDQGTGNGNTIEFVSQNRFEGREGNEARIVQEGSGNAIDAVVQRARGDSAAGRNVIDLRFTGNDNGTRDLTGFAASVEAVSGFRQGPAASAPNNDNRQRFIVTGDRNQIGTQQRGTGNRMTEWWKDGPLFVTGSDNQLGSVQEGTDNLLYAVINGDRNNVGTRQVGDANTLKVIISNWNGPAVWSEDNAVRAEQLGVRNEANVNITGDLNIATLLQDGTGNVAAFTVIGDSNRIDGRQDGDDHRATITQTGSFNSATFSQVGALNTITVMQ